jgi:hypothetical protein
MNLAVSASAPTPLLFHWESPRRRRAAITVFLVASLVAHALCFYIFQIVYPPTVALLPPPARVSLIAPDSEEGRTLLRWIEAEDPALAFATHRPPEARSRALPKVPHVPTYLGHEPILKQAPRLVVDLRIPSSQAPGAVPIVYQRTELAIGAIPTTVSFSEELDVLGTPNLPPPKFAASSSESAQNVRFRVAVGDAGYIRHCFPLNSSGDPALDEQARSYLAFCRFPQKSKSDGKNESALTWGVATIEWGNDITRTQATSISTPAP